MTDQELKLMRDALAETCWITACLSGHFAKLEPDHKFWFMGHAEVMGDYARELDPRRFKENPFIKQDFWDHLEPHSN
jgi:hypothetical protein